jgi:hypothetical protein
MAMYRKDFERQAKAQSLSACSMGWHPLPCTQRLPMENATQVLWVLGYGLLLLSQMDVNGRLAKRSGEASQDGTG